MPRIHSISDSQMIRIFFAQTGLLRWYSDGKQENAMSAVYTIGHSSHTFETFAGLLAGHGIEVVVDTRSAPYSKYAPQFDREALRRDLTACGVKYLFLGEELGGRPRGDDFYDATGRVLYGKRRNDAKFQAGMERLERGMAQFRVALM